MTKKKSIALITAVLLITTMFIFASHITFVGASQTITEVSQGTNGVAKGSNSTGATVTVTLSQAPAVGDLLSVEVMSINTAPTVRSVSTMVCTNVAFTQSAVITWTANYGMDVEIWKGVPSASASTTLTVTMSGACANGVEVIVGEYTIGDSSATWTLDQTATNTTAASTHTTQQAATTAPTIQQAPEVCIAGLLNVNRAWISVSDSYTLRYGSIIAGYCGGCYAEYIATSQVTANTVGSMSSTGNPSIGCIATFYATGTTPTPSPTATPTGWSHDVNLGGTTVPNSQIQSVGIGGTYLTKSQIQSVGGVP